MTMKVQINYQKLVLVTSLILLFILLTITNSNSLDSSNYLKSQVNDFLTIYRSIIVQSIPFILLGSAISALVAIFLNNNLLKYIPKNKFLSHVFVALIGMFMPVCECGNIPVAKRMIIKGMSVSQAFTFMLAAPIINPITILSTYEAFKTVYDNEILMPSLRVILGFLIATSIGITLSFQRNQLNMLTPEFYKEVCGTNPHDTKASLPRFLDIFKSEFLGVFLSLNIGSMIASILQVFLSKNILLNVGIGILISLIGLIIYYFIAFILKKGKLGYYFWFIIFIISILVSIFLPQSIIFKIEASTLLSILVMITISFIISVCSSVDAFIAIGYLNYPIGSILAFLIFGPMIDIKLLTILRKSFKFEILLFISLLVTFMSIVAGLLVNFFFS